MPGIREQCHRSGPQAGTGFRNHLGQVERYSDRERPIPAVGRGVMVMVAMIVAMVVMVAVTMMRVRHAGQLPAGRPERHNSQAPR